ncbi:MAG: cardiolipin synthase [Flavobacteriaceae bacterium]|nr:cardiolipin synthase [Flavobacteriaceae bacterium]
MVQEIFYYILLIVHGIINLVAFYYLLKEGNKPYRIWAWMMTIFAIPAIGGILFFVFGLNRKKNKLFNQKALVDEQQIKTFLKEYATHIQPYQLEDTQINSRYGKLVRYLTNANKIPLAHHNKVTVLDDGEETFRAIFKACEAANHSIFIQYYIFEHGTLADRFLQLFKKKRAQGVTIKFLYDGLGSWSLKNSYRKKMTAAGIAVQAFLPVKLAALAKTNYRNHRKIIIIDEKIAFTGGINVDDKYINGDPILGHWTDMHLQLEGMAVNFLKFVFHNDWYFASGENLFTGNALRPLGKIGKSPVQIVSSGPDSKFETILNEYLYLINHAERYVYIANPYLIPTQSLKEALQASALSGVDVRIIVPKNSDSLLVKWTVQSYFEPLLESGVKIYLFEPGFLHSKIILSDDLVYSIGTANLDIRSFEQNFEVNALIYDADVTQKVRQRFIKYQQSSTLVRFETFRQRGRLSRMLESLCRLLSPIT